MDFPAPASLIESAEKGAQIRSASWTIPHTDITLARTDEGPKQGAFRFSAATVSDARRFFDKVRDLPYRRDVPLEQEFDQETLDEPEPQIVMLSSGEMTPFEWRINDANTASGIVLQGNLLGGVLMTGPEPLT